MRRTESRSSDLGETSGLGFTHHPRLPQYPEGQEETQTCFLNRNTKQDRMSNRYNRQSHQVRL